MTQYRFFGHIHSVIGHIMMISPRGDESLQERCSIDDFEHFIPVTPVDGVKAPRFVFSVKEDYIGIRHYNRWLGLEKVREDKLDKLQEYVESINNTLQDRASDPMPEPAYVNTDAYRFNAPKPPIAAFDDMIKSSMEPR